MKSCAKKAIIKNRKQLTERQLMFCENYIVSLNGTKAAELAGYSKKTAYSIANNLLKNIEIKKAIETLMSSKKKATIASQNEVLELLTIIARGETYEEVVAVEGRKSGGSAAAIIKKRVAPKDQAKALELLGRRYGLFVEHITVDSVPQIIDDIPIVEDNHDATPN